VRASGDRITWGVADGAGGPAFAADTVTHSVQGGDIGGMDAAIGQGANIGQEIGPVAASIAHQLEDFVG
jgi:hypothetical protein